MTELNKCPICESSSLEDFLTINDHSISKENFTVKKCSNCGLKITSPRPSDDELGRYYESEDYVSHSDTNKGLINSLYQRVKSITLKQKEKLIASFNGRNTLLDIGCGTGDFLLYCKNKGCDVSGLEPDVNARKKALEKGLEDISDSSKLNDLADKSFAVITMWHVLEHVSDLNKYMDQLHRILDQEGRLIIAVPNPDSPDAKKYKEHWAAYDVPRHLFHFSKHNIKDLANKHDFNLENIKPMLFDSFYVSMLSEKYKNGSIFNAAINGLFSNLKASRDKNHSSLIYILAKNKK